MRPLRKDKKASTRQEGAKADRKYVVPAVELGPGLGIAQSLFDPD